MFLLLLWVSRGNWQFRLIILQICHWFSRCFVTACRHLEKSSDHLFKMFFFLPFINCSFFSRHRLHLLEPTLYTETFFMIDHVMLNFRFSVFSPETYLDSCVSFEYFWCRKDFKTSNNPNKRCRHVIKHLLFK